ncbi:MAG: ABC transporter substrate-binding protein [Acidimicrobiales bacterium]|nr:ABC transporter substrate-binding protein [Acidimicrobiales bacterium]
MRNLFTRPLLLVTAFTLLSAACGGSDDDQAASSIVESTETTTTTAAETTTEAVITDFPISLDTLNGTVTIVDRPQRILSLSATATEILFAVGAGAQVIAVDSFSNYPAEAPITDLSAFEPNFEAISTYEPDLVITSFDPENALTEAFSLLDVPVLIQGGALSLEDTYRQIAEIGLATGNVDEAAAVVGQIRQRVDAALARTTGTDSLRIYHELDDTYFSVSSASFLGDIYNQLGFENIADPADPDGFGYPQLTPESIVEADPQLIIITDQVGYTAQDVAARPGWDAISAVSNGAIEQVDADIASRWGPRIAEYVEQMADIATAVKTG